jgi:ribonuclease R
MSDKVGEQLTAIVTGVEAFGVFAQGVEIPAEGLIPLANLPDDRYDFDRAARTLSGFREENQFRLGDQIQVKVGVVDPDQRTLEFELVGIQPSRANSVRRGKTGAPASETKDAAKPKPAPAKSPMLPYTQSASKKSAGGDWESVRASGPQKGHRKKKNHSKKKKPSKKSSSKRKSKAVKSRSSKAKKSKKSKASKKASGKKSKDKSQNKKSSKRSGKSSAKSGTKASRSGSSMKRKSSKKKRS